ncbi:hypothetical protein [Streptomyces mobaraensis]|uniref:hypothetical protein n=1 Tax=Streptomyces mobaraensis TaxID=35621 RepID=UPI0033E79580
MTARQEPTRVRPGDAPRFPLESVQRQVASGWGEHDTFFSPGNSAEAKQPDILVTGKASAPFAAKEKIGDSGWYQDRSGY